MKLYLITNDVGGYDAYHGHIIAAESEHEARLYAIEQVAEEGIEAWNTEHSTIKVIAESTDEPAGLILSDFNAG